MLANSLIADQRLSPQIVWASPRLAQWQLRGRRRQHGRRLLRKCCAGGPGHHQTGRTRSVIAEGIGHGHRRRTPTKAGAEKPSAGWSRRKQCLSPLNPLRSRHIRPPGANPVDQGWRCFFLPRRDGTIPNRGIRLGRTRKRHGRAKPAGIVRIRRQRRTCQRTTSCRTRCRCYRRRPSTIDASFARRLR